jgi:hypothetical protein
MRSVRRHQLDGELARHQPGISLGKAEVVLLTGRLALTTWASNRIPAQGERGSRGIEA